MIELNDVLLKAGVDPAQVMVMRHRPPASGSCPETPTCASWEPTDHAAATPAGCSVPAFVSSVVAAFAWLLPLLAVAVDLSSP